MLTKQNKVEKIADRSAAGWNTVEEYLIDGLADDSADEKKIKAAEERALVKHRKKSDHMSFATSSTITSNEKKVAPLPSYGSPAAPPPQTIILQQADKVEKESGRNYSQGAQASFRRSDADRSNSDGLCYGCGHHGHLCASYPRRRR